MYQYLLIRLGLSGLLLTLSLTPAISLDPSFPIQNTWIKKIAPLPLRTGVTVTPATPTYHVGDAFTGSGRVFFDSVSLVRAQGQACIAYIRQEDGKSFFAKVKIHNAGVIREIVNEGLKTLSGGVPCHAFAVALAGGSKVTVAGNIERLQTVDPAGNPMPGAMVIDRMDIQAEDVRGELAVTDDPIHSCSADGTLCGGTGVVKTISIFRNDPDKLCEAVIAGTSGGYFKLLVTIPAADLYPADNEVVQSLTEQTLIRTCDLLIDAFNGANVVSAHGKKVTWGVIDANQLDLLESLETYRAVLPPPVF